MRLLLVTRLEFTKLCFVTGASQVMLVVKNLPANAGDVRDLGSIHGSGRSPGGGHGNPLQYSYLDNPMDRGAWQATIHRVTKTRTWLKQPSTHTWTYECDVCQNQKWWYWIRLKPVDEIQRTEPTAFLLFSPNFGHKDNFTELRFPK